MLHAHFVTRFNKDMMMMTKFEVTLTCPSVLEIIRFYYIYCSGSSDQPELIYGNSGPHPRRLVGDPYWLRPVEFFEDPICHCHYEIIAKLNLGLFEY